MSFFIYQSSGSGSESAIPNKKPVKTESSEGSENDASISDEDQGNENGSNGLGDRDGGSDNGSGTQVICFHGNREQLCLRNLFVSFNWFSIIITEFLDQKSR